MARHRGLEDQRGVLPDAVLCSFPLELTAVTTKVALQFNELDHGVARLAIGSVTRRDTAHTRVA